MITAVDGAGFTVFRCRGGAEMGRYRRGLYPSRLRVTGPMTKRPHQQLRTERVGHPL